MPEIQGSPSSQPSNLMRSPAPLTKRDGKPAPLHIRSDLNDPAAIPITQSHPDPCGSPPVSGETSETSSKPYVSLPTGLSDPAFPPSATDTPAALADLRQVLESESGNSKGEQLFYKRIGAMIQLLEAHSAGEAWIAASKRVSSILGRSSAWPLKLRRWTKDFIRDRSELPYPRSAFRGPPPYIDDEGLREDVTWYLRENHVNISPKTVIDYLKDPNVQARYHIHHNDILTHTQARHWMADLGFFPSSQAGRARRGWWVRRFEDWNLLFLRSDSYTQTASDVFLCF